MVSVMQNHYFTPYSSTNQYPCYNGGLEGGYPMRNYFGYWPWGFNSGNMTTANPVKCNGPNANVNQYGGHFGYPQFVNPTYNQWGRYPYSSWFNAGQTYPQTMSWPLYQNPFWTNQWNLGSGHNGTYYAWPTMNYFQNQIQYPNYSWPSPVYWGFQQTFSYKPEVQKGGGADQKTRTEEKGAVVLMDTTSDVINAYHVPSRIARKTVSDIPRSKEYSISLKKSEASTLKGESEDELPFLLKISDTSIRQIAPSRSFGPSMVYNTDSDPNNRPPSSQW